MGTQEESAVLAAIQMFCYENEHFRVKLELVGDEWDSARRLVTAGMNVTADIRTDERRMIEYLLAPMLRYKQEAMRER